MKNYSARKASLIATTLAVLLSAKSAYAAMPWESPISKILSSISGPVAAAMVTFGIIGGATLLIMGESGGFWRRALAAVFGGAIMIGAGSLATELFQ